MLPPPLHNGMRSEGKVAFFQHGSDKKDGHRETKVYVKLDNTGQLWRGLAPKRKGLGKQDFE
jgi:hypothetical protein